jgi:hypothetical protein
LLLEIREVMIEQFPVMVLGATSRDKDENYYT